jgi:hypothetical protein
MLWKRCEEVAMSRTSKDSRHITKTILKIVKRADGKFDLFFNGNLSLERLEEVWLRKELCERFGYCGNGDKELLRMMVELHREGTTKATF